MRVVSLSPSNTELIYAIGAGDLLVGRTIHCDYPPEAKALSSIGSLFPADYERILSRRPDLIVMSDGNARVRQRLKTLGLKVLTVHPRTVADIAHSMRFLGKNLGRVKTANQRADAFTRELQRWAPKNTSKERLLYEVWHKPLMIPGKGTFLADLIRRAGGQPIGQNLSGNWPRVDIEAAIAFNPTLILTKSATHRARYLNKDSPWRHVTAITQRRVFVIPAEAHFVRPGPRVILAIRWLRGIIERSAQSGAKP